MRHVNSQTRMQIITFLRVLGVGGFAQPVIAGIAPLAHSDWRYVATAAVIGAVENVIHSVWPKEPQGAVNGVLGKAAAWLLRVQPPASSTPPAK